MKCLDTDLLVGVLRKQEKAARKIEDLDKQGRHATTAVNAFKLFYGATLLQESYAVATENKGHVERNTRPHSSIRKGTPTETVAD